MACLVNTLAQKSDLTIQGQKSGLEILSDKIGKGQRLIAQLVERAHSVMKDPGSSLGADIYSFHY
jgi:hypothetical protein